MQRSLVAEIQISITEEVVSVTETEASVTVSVTENVTSFNTSEVGPAGPSA
jgi:hypothetical protein